LSGAGIVVPAAVGALSVGVIGSGSAEGDGTGAGIVVSLPFGRVAGRVIGHSPAEFDEAVVIVVSGRLALSVGGSAMAGRLRGSKRRLPRLGGSAAVASLSWSVG
jgi:hypothetical protein